MNTYLRIISFARPLGRYVPAYVLFTLVYVVFSAVNLSVLVPLLDILFNQIDPETLDRLLQKPQAELSIDYIIAIFQYYFASYMTEFGKMGALYFVCTVVVFASLVSNSFRYFAALILARVRANVVTNLRNTLFERIVSMDLQYFTEEKKGDILSRVTNDIQQIENTVVESLKVVFREPALIAGYFVVMIIISPELTLYTVLILPISGIVISWIAKRLKRKAAEGQVSLGFITTVIDEALTGIRIIKAFLARLYMVGKFGRETEKYGRISISMARKRDAASPVSEFLGVLTVAILILIGGSLVFRAQLSASEFITFIIIFARILQPAKAISNAYSNIQRGLASGERIFETIDLQPEIRNAPDAISLEGFNDKIELKNVSFAYEKQPVLIEIDITINKGQIIALVGPSGAGKSTLADLIPRFYDVNEGEVLIDGRPVTAYTIESVRKHMGIVTQDSILFNDTVFNNIAFGIPDADAAIVQKAAEIANAHDFISELPEGYDTVIGTMGSKLSGGQKQRLSIARAILKNPPILILDEATSALDSESEHLVQEALYNLMKDRTSIIIAHRLSTIQHADKIFVLQDGKIVEQGTHESLLSKGGVYKKLKLMQSV